ncbi:AAA family ATPase [Rhodococcus coprophilus]|uniref:bifunctional aminoglycoside phosphotransferase/ATP-binding protein n=1 Tax=Rhodococcus coprophilus TaxID=38310 RepID=UPI001E12313C|nr:AAA family ATPase [Rhodococcus coprophilus]MBM7458092.1 aminoglycoside phosphotransferase family enzyme [Rhodococcus coprophilus]
MAVPGSAEVDGAGYAAVRETHTSVLFLVGDRVHKMKKPLDLGFLDNRTRAARERACHREVDLNRRMAPDVYLGVADVHGPDGQVCEHLVEMVRLPDDRRLAMLARRGDEIDPILDSVARQVARLHASSPRDAAIDRCASADFLSNLWALSLDHLERLPVGIRAASAVVRIRTAATRYIEGRAPLFAARIEAGRAVDGHGDLLADDIFCLDDGPRIIDCLEFDDELRYGDGLLDIAFLAMDLERAGAEGAARKLLHSYAVATGDEPPRSLVHHYIAYRALVRAKVTALRHEQGDEASGAVAMEFLAQVERHLERARVRLVLVGGVAGTGKSTLSRTIGGYLGASVLRSDVIRKELAGIGPTDRTGDDVDSGLYSSVHTDATYEEMMARASAELAHGRSVVLDATWLSEVQRVRAREVAVAAAAEVVEIECRADTAVLVDRIRARAERDDDPSDATPAVLAAQLDRRDEWPAAVVVDTTGPGAVDDAWSERELGLAPW